MTGKLQLAVMTYKIRSTASPACLSWHITLAAFTRHCRQRLQTAANLRVSFMSDLSLILPALLAVWRFINQFIIIIMPLSVDTIPVTIRP